MRAWVLGVVEAPWSLLGFRTACLFSVTRIHFQMALKSHPLLSSLLFFFCLRALLLFKHHFTVILAGSWEEYVISSSL